MSVTRIRVLLYLTVSVFHEVRKQETESKEIGLWVTDRPIRLIRPNWVRREKGFTERER
jgi:hypothetical protein